MKEAVYYSEFTGRTARSHEDWYDLAHEEVAAILRCEPGDAGEEKEIAERLAALETRFRQDDRTWRAGQDGWWRSYVRDLA
jgi:hypothetical protein